MYVFQNITSEWKQQKLILIVKHRFSKQFLTSSKLLENVYLAKRVFLTLSILYLSNWQKRKIIYYNYKDDFKHKKFEEIKAKYNHLIDKCMKEKTVSIIMILLIVLDF